MNFYRSGYIFQPSFIDFCAANNKIYTFSTELLDKIELDDDNLQTVENKLNHIMENKITVTIDWKMELFGKPENGEIVAPKYINSIKILKK